MVSVRTAFEGKTARAFTNKFDEESSAAGVRSSESLAKVQHPDPDLLPMPDARESCRCRRGLTGDSPVRTHQFHPAISKSTAAHHARAACGRRQEDCRCCGEHTTSRPPEFFPARNRLEGIFNSRGLSNWHTQTSAEVSITMLGGDSSGWQKANSPDVANLNPSVLAETAAKKR